MILSILALATGACGGAAQTGLFDEPSGPGTPDSGHPVDSGDHHDVFSPPPTTDSALPDRSEPDVGGIDAGMDTGPTEPPLYCGSNTTCAAMQQICCVTPDPLMINPPTYQCMGTSSATDCADNSGVPVSCGGAEDCPGQICCGTRSSADAEYDHVRCATSCSGTYDVQFCDAPPAPDECTGQGLMCQESTLVPGYYVCG
jgi:hypothetical protein